MTRSPENQATRSVRRRYNRFAPVYDFVDGLLERRYRRWRVLLWSKVEGKDVLEVGVGTGRNFPYYPKDVRVTAVDLSEGMLARARRKAARNGFPVRLEQMDIERLDFPDDSFDSVVGSWVFCSVADPLRGLREVRRVTRSDGKVVLLEHVLSPNRAVGAVMNALNPLVSRLGPDNINRRTAEHVPRSELRLEHVTDLAYGIFILIEARK